MSPGKRLVTLLSAFALSASLAACGSDSSTAPAGTDTTGVASDQTIVLYSGRNENLIAPLIPLLEEQIGATIDVRYAGTAELAAQILEEGPSSPADVFLSQDAGALGALSAAGMLTPLGGDVVDSVPEEYRATDDS